MAMHRLTTYPYVTCACIFPQTIHKQHSIHTWAAAEAGTILLRMTPNRSVHEKSTNLTPSRFTASPKVSPGFERIAIPMRLKKLVPIHLFNKKTGTRACFEKKDLTVKLLSSI